MSCYRWWNKWYDIVDGFERVDEGYLIKTKPHKYNANDTSHLANLKTIGGIINTTEKWKKYTLKNKHKKVGKPSNK